uniref:Uncharacterized protein n=1 Tax=Salix viminalis TaxID=40686 RepID=A0A6N2MYD2_SALVM
MDIKPLALAFKHVVYSVILKLAYGRGFSKWFYDHDQKGIILRQSSNFVSINLIFLISEFTSCKCNLGAIKRTTPYLKKILMDKRLIGFHALNTLMVIV